MLPPTGALLQEHLLDHIVESLLLGKKTGTTTARGTGRGEEEENGSKNEIGQTAFRTMSFCR